MVECQDTIQEVWMKMLEYCMLQCRELKKRLYITYENKVSEFLGDYDQVMEHFVEMHPDKKARLLNLENILVNSSNSTD